MTQAVDLRHRDMLDMIPRFYDDAPEADGILYADAIEVERVRADARDLLAQLSATTATWGLSDWERVLELSPRPNSSADLRRARILAKLRGTAPATLANMLAIINAHVPQQDANIVELLEPGTFIVDIPLQRDISLTGLVEDLNVYKPAHLAYEIYGTIADVLRISERFYSFEIANLICNEFTTDDSYGIGVFTRISTIGRDYKIDVKTPITNEMICGDFYAEEEN